MAFSRPLLGSLIAFAMAILAATPAQAWWNSDWTFREKVHLDTSAKGANITDALGHVQVLLRLNQTNFNFDAAAQDGTDLRVIAADDRTPLHFQIERYDGLADLVALVWVDVPNLAPGVENSVYVYWGNKNAKPESDGKATFISDQVLVYHFANETGPPKDSTNFNNDALLGAEHGATGLIGGDAKFNGQNAVLLPKSETLKLAAGAAMTWSMWVRPNPGAPTQTATLFSQTDGTSGFAIGLDQGVPYAEITAADGPHRAAGTAPLDPTTWHLLVVTASDKLTLSVDGAPAVAIAATLPSLTSGASLGGVAAATAAAPASATPAAATSATPPNPATPSAPDAAAGGPPTVTNGYVGEMDEFRITRGVVSPGLVALRMTEKNFDKFETFDVAEQASSFGSGPFPVIIRSVTPDAWVVIILLMLMSATSWWVMIAKVLFLNKVAKANGVFEQQYRVVSAPGATAGAAATDISSKRTPLLRRSPLYRLYTVGTRELDQRLEAGLLEPDGRLAPQSIEAMRSSVEATLVRESQRMSSLMVLLTICISGGPFLGLLGTVVGVMITFAAIAQAGDVNVNAIAPGIAAALLATVAGLFVAIPALFGYNYLVTRIKEIGAQMNAFSAELVSKMAEQVRKPGAAR
jgi:biopolymer transport protein ExbB